MSDCQKSCSHQQEFLESGTQEYLERWGVVDNVTTQLSGEPYEGTTIDRDEPFVIRWSPSYSNHLSPASAVMRTAGS